MLNTITEKTELKDVLHHYFDCEVVITFWSRHFDKKLTLAPEYKIGVLKSIGKQLNNTVVCEVAYDSTYSTFNADKIKPVLRALSSMTTIEQKQYSSLRNTSLLPSEEMRLQAIKTKYLLDRGFDVFGLIESDQAIDQTKI